MEQLLELLESTRKSKAHNEAIRDAFLEGGIQFGYNGNWEKPEDTAAKYQFRSEQDQELIEILERMMDEAKS